MKIVIPGGSGQVGRLLQRRLHAEGNEIVVLGRRACVVEPGVRLVQWDGSTLGAWTDEIDGADAVINLAGRSVSCRYTPSNLNQMMSSRVDSTRAVGQAIAKAARPPAIWLQMSTATIYADTREGINDEAAGVIGGNERDVPDYWEYSVRIARNWEAAQQELDIPTRRVALRSAMVMTEDQGGIFDVLSMMARTGLGGPIAGGRQMVSWIHGDDFANAVLFLLGSDIEGPVNLSSPNPVQQGEFMRDLRRAWGRHLGLPATESMAALGAWALRTDPELLLKSRSVVPGRLVDAGFEFSYPAWLEASSDLVRRVQTRPEGDALLPVLSRVVALGRAS